MVLVFIWLSELASGKRLAAHIIVRKYSKPEFGFVQGNYTIYNHSSKRFIKGRNGLE